MIVFGLIPLPGRNNLGADLAIPPMVAPLLLRTCCDIFRYLLLLFVVEEYRATVLRTLIRPLHVRRRRVMHSVEEFNQLSIADLIRIVDDLQGFGIYIASPGQQVSS